MKATFLFLLISCFLTAHAQTGKSPVSIDSTTSKVKYEVIINQTGSKDDLFSKAQSWIASTFKNTKAVIDVSDRAGGQLLFSGNATTVYIDTLFNKKHDVKKISTVGCHVFFKGKFYVKDAKYKFIVTDISMIQDFLIGSDPMPLDVKYVEMWATDTYNGPFTKLFNATDVGIRNLISSATTYMAQKSESDF
ncbi:protein of unknown function [Mucilaginibacter lappiensis]|uniref:DUF4468 domain-containing protein n=1 Tax=Mucilaginibacter lappiensis TaxID=354630 RepID=A0ABR6PKI4_9SPHI|nr:DUF4468 domain-containing protein [Mucilaginibacter lappiensis]MBB6109724.1 hypothetical protein [Mucilaginibacter lappiensis]SIR13190.1 protein of unknown function [Mucilaginibacter lappiensis]